MAFAPVAVSKSELIAILCDVIARVADDDSFEGYINYTMPDYEDESIKTDFMLEARYRIGNKDGQGGMRMIGNMEQETGEQQQLAGEDC